MNIRLLLKCAVFSALLMAVGGCKDQGQKPSPINDNALAKNDLGGKQKINLNETNSIGQFFQSEVLAKSTPEMTVAPPPLSSSLVPPPPPPVPAPIPVDDLVGGFEEYDGPIYNLCGNGVLNRVVNRIACPAFGPKPIFDAPILIPPAVIVANTCVGFVYIEQCDDGNIIDNDGCSSVCLKECCGNGIVEDGEECDLGQNRGPVLPNISPPANFPIQGPTAIPGDANSLFTRPFAACSRPDLVTDTQNCSRNCQFIICGDGIVNGNEQCDDGNNLCCDGCFKCTLERPGACPCNCCPDAVCDNVCCKPNEICDANKKCACPATKCNNVCCNLNETCVSNTCTCVNEICNGVCCAPGQICRGDACI